MPNPPPNLRDAIHGFVKLPAQTRAAVVQAFQTRGPSITLDDLAESVASQSNADRSIVLGLAYGLGRLVLPAMEDATFGRGLAEFFTQDVLSAGANEADATELQSELQKLLLCEKSIGITAKAQSILWGHGKAFKSGHVITQIRPIFYSDLSNDASHAVIVHELRIEFKEQSFESNFCITLDRAQILELQRVLDRALRKEGTLKTKPRFDYLSSLERGTP